VGDSIKIATRHTQVVALITERFWQQSALVARAHGLSDVPRVELPYPLAGTGTANLRRVAASVAPAVLRALGVSHEPAVDAPPGAR
jgi:hypothetical protein